MDEYSDDEYYSQSAIHPLIIAAGVLLILWIMYDTTPHETYLPCYGDCENQKLPAKNPVVINTYMWPYSGATCMEDLYIADRNIRGNSTAQPLVSLNTPDHTVLSSVSFVV